MMILKMTCEVCEYMDQNVHIFRGNAKLKPEERDFLYLTYNQVFQDSKKPNGCGACQRGVIDGLKKAYEKHCAELWQTKKEQETLHGLKESQEIQKEDQKVQRTKQPKKSGKHTKS